MTIRPDSDVTALAPVDTREPPRVASSTITTVIIFMVPRVAAIDWILS